MVSEIKLEKAIWLLDDKSPLGPPGGFGEVFKGQTSDGAPVAIKRLKLTAAHAAHREIKIGEWLSRRDLRHVVSVLDYGQDAETDRYYLVMPECDYSLQSVLSREGPFDWSGARDIALDIISGLVEANGVVHRDLKPGNVLWHNGVWKVADFGIAKFVEDSTSLETLRDALTPAYAAPEQWDANRPTTATDVYALGCIMHALIRGGPPFKGSVDELKAAHLLQVAPPVSGIGRLNSLVSSMLRKSPLTRPSLESCGQILRGIDIQRVSSSNGILANAGAQIATAEAEKEAAENQRQIATKEWNQIAGEGCAELGPLIKGLFDVISNTCDAAKLKGRTISMGKATLALNGPSPLPFREESSEGVSHPWIVAAQSILELQTPLLRHVDSGPDIFAYSSNLIFAKNEHTTNFRWYELNFFSWSGQSVYRHAPFALPIESREFHLALSPIMSSWQIATGPWSIDLEGEEGFHDRWTALFAKAALGNLLPPSNFPIPDAYFRT